MKTTNTQFKKNTENTVRDAVGYAKPHLQTADGDVYYRVSCW